MQDNEGNEKFPTVKEVISLAEQVRNKLMNTDSEYWVLVIGNTGTGKSLRAQQLGYMIDSTIHIDRVCFDKKEFVQAVMTAQKGQVLIADEGISMFFNRSAMTRESRLIMELIYQIRQKNLCVFICVPDISSMDRLILKKVNCIMEVSEVKEGTALIKGCVSFYPNLPSNNPHKRFAERLIHYFDVKKRNPFYKLTKPKALFRWKGSHVGANCKKPWYPVGEEEYRKKKGDILKKYLEPVEKPQTPAGIKREVHWKEQRDKLAEKLLELGLKRSEIGEIIGVTSQNFTVIKQSLAKNAKKVV
jgi:hypothetical protein